MSTTVRGDNGNIGTDYDAVVVGAGFAGLYAVHHLREQGLSVQGIERAADVGGTWYYNRYPGARCDTESHLYQYQFSDELQEEWRYSERYPEQGEILEYLQFVSEFLDLRKDIRFNTTVDAIEFDTDPEAWTVSLEDNDELTSDYVILALGFLSEPYTPDFDGLGEFEGEMYHTAKWPRRDVSFYRKDIGVIGTGSSGIQATPRIAADAEHVTIYQRTPNYIVPANNYPVSEVKRDELLERSDEIWERAQTSDSGFPYDSSYPSAEGLADEEVEYVLENHWNLGGFEFLSAFEDVLSNEVTNERVCEFIRAKLYERFDDPELIEKLTPEGYPYAAKRPPLNYENNRYDWDFYETVKQAHVDLVDVDANPIEALTADGIRTTDSQYSHDMVVLATGFDAVTGSYNNISITGTGGTSLEEKWGKRPRTYLGMAVDEFPNLFMVSGPQSPSPITNQVLCIEDQVEWIYDIIEHAQRNGTALVEAKGESVEYWINHTASVAESTLYTEAESWYQGDNIPGKTDVFLPYPGGYPAFDSKLTAEKDSGYDGFHMRKSTRQVHSD